MNCSKSKLKSNYSGAATALWIWLALGVAVMLLFPGLRGSDPRLGWLPFWLVVAPVIDLAILRRYWLAATLRTLFVHVRHWRRPTRQARRLQTPASEPAFAVIVARGLDQSVIPSRLRSIRRRNSSMMRRYKSSPR